MYFCNCTEVRSEERWVLYPATEQQIEQIVSKSKTPAEVFRDSRVVYIYTIGLDTDQGTLRELTVDELSDADKLPEGEYVQMSKHELGADRVFHEGAGYCE